MFLVSFIVPWLVKKGLGESAAKGVAWTGIIIAAVLLAVIGWSLLKGAIIDRHDLETRAAHAEHALKQTNAADQVDERLEARDDAVTADLQEGARNAAQADPTGAAKPVGPVSRSVHDGLRSARKRAAPAD